MARRPDRLTTTGGSDEREGRSLIAALMRFQLGDEAARLRMESAYVEGDRNARTLVKADDFRLVLVAFRGGAEFDESDQRGSIALQVLEGQLSVSVAGEQALLEQGEVAVVSAQHAWRAAAATDGLMLLHLAWPSDPGAVAD
jgi:quercetin dioxygenase-like cupin family protein